VCIQSGAPASLNLNDRIQGSATPGPVAPIRSSGRETDGQNGWSEPGWLPGLHNDDINLAPSRSVTSSPPIPSSTLSSRRRLGRSTRPSPTAPPSPSRAIRVKSKDLVTSSVTT